jgi:ABC-2 type transport system permease protein
MPDRKSGLMALVRARVLLFVREPAVLFWVFAFPIILAVVLGLAFRDRPPEPPRVGLPADRSKIESLDSQVNPLLASDRLTLISAPRAELDEKLRKGAIDLIVDWDTARTFTYRYDAQRPEGRLARLVVDDVVQRGLGRKDLAEFREATEMPRGARYIDFLMPGLIAMNLMGSALWGVGYGMVQERSKKLMRRFATTPLSASAFLGSYVLSRLVFLAVEVAFLITFGSLAFDVVIEGSLALFFFTSLLGVLCFTGFAVLCASRTPSVEVVSGFINALTMPAWLLSGTFFSYERFPDALHPFIQALPLTALNDALRQITNDGAGLAQIWPELAVLTGWGLFTFALGVRLFRWR